MQYPIIVQNLFGSAFLRTFFILTCICSIVFVDDIISIIDIFRFKINETFKYFGILIYISNVSMLFVE